MVVARTQVTRAPPRQDALDREPPATSAMPTSSAPSAHPPIRILRLGQVIEVTGLGKSKLYELQAAGQFPMRVQITAHTVGWVEEEVQAWLARRIAARPAVPARSTARPASR